MNILIARTATRSWQISAWRSLHRVTGSRSISRQTRPVRPTQNGDLSLARSLICLQNKRRANRWIRAAISSPLRRAVRNAVRQATIWRTDRSGSSENDHPRRIAATERRGPRAYRNIVEKALEKNPAERYQSLRDMVVDLTTSPASQFGPATIPAHRGHASRTRNRFDSWSNQPTWFAWGAAAVFLVALAALSLIHFRERPVGARAGSISDLSTRKYSSRATRLRYRLTAAISHSPRPVLMAWPACGSATWTRWRFGRFQIATLNL